MKYVVRFGASYLNIGRSENSPGTRYYMLTDEANAHRFFTEDQATLSAKRYARLKKWLDSVELPPYEIVEEPTTKRKLPWRERFVRCWRVTVGVFQRAFD